MKPVSLIVTVLLSVVAIAHLVRLVLKVPVVVSGMELPLWISGIGFIVPATLAFFLWHESRK
jgi:hypothetical protein